MLDSTPKFDPEIPREQIYHLGLEIESNKKGDPAVLRPRPFDSIL